MAITADQVKQYAPHGNAKLAFVLSKEVYSTDAATGNTVVTKANQETVEYLAAVNLQRPNWKGEPGVDNTAYSCTGRLLTPAKFDERITNGSQADAVINGYQGRFELIWDLTMDKGHYTDLRQSVEGTFRVVGGKGGSSGTT